MRLPPLNALRVFEVAARHASFTRAAEELHVTQSAVSKQVATLEDHLGRALFIRGHRSLELTEAGQMCARAARHSFELLEQKLSLLDGTASHRMTVLTDVDFARLWLFPRLPEFEGRYPEMQISLATKNFTAPVTEQESFDLAISWGRGDWVDLLFEPLFTNEVFPVCAPDFFGDEVPSMETVRGHQLIHDRDHEWWTLFLGKMQVRGLSAEEGRVFTQTGLCLDAAARGDGIAIGDEVTARDYLEKGTLIIPFPLRMPSPDAYYILVPKARGYSQESLRLFRNWLVEEATRHRTWFASFWAGGR